MQIPSRVNQKGDLCEWCKKFGPWASTMKAATELDEDRSYTTNFIILSLMLYNHLLSSEERNLVYEAQEKKIINYSQTDNL